MSSPLEDLPPSVAGQAAGIEQEYAQLEQGATTWAEPVGEDGVNPTEALEVARGESDSTGLFNHVLDKAHIVIEDASSVPSIPIEDHQPDPNVGTQVASSGSNADGRRAAYRIRDQRAAALFRRLEHGDEKAKEAVVETFMPLARALARKYARSPETRDDLIQVASFGLVNAVNRFDRSRGFSFDAFATTTILGEIRRHFRDKTWATHVPRGLQERALAVRDIVSEAEGRGHTPTLKELADKLKITEVEASEAWQACTYGYEATSLSNFAHNQEGMPQTALVERLVDPRAHAAHDKAVQRTELLAAIDELDPKLKLIVVATLEGWTQARIASHLGVSPTQVSVKLKEATEALGDRLDG